MDEQNRFKLLFGPYKAPLFNYGDVLHCERRGDLIVCGLSDARIPWPIGKKGRNGRARSLILTGDLVRAARQESAIVVCHWWGVTQSVVTKWRKILGVPLSNEGTHRLRHEYALEPGVTAGRLKAIKKAQDPEVNAKRAETHRGKTCPDHVRRRLSELRTGSTMPAETRRKISATLKRKGHMPATVGPRWTKGEDRLVGTLPPKEVATKTGRTLQAVHTRRVTLGISRERGYNGMN